MTKQTVQILNACRIHGIHFVEFRNLVLFYGIFSFPRDIQEWIRDFPIPDF